MDDGSDGGGGAKEGITVEKEPADKTTEGATDEASAFRVDVSVTVALG